jgi:hypothetical protein
MNDLEFECQPVVFLVIRQQICPVHEDLDVRSDKIPEVKIWKLQHYEILYD